MNAGNSVMNTQSTAAQYGDMNLDEVQDDGGAEAKEVPPRVRLQCNDQQQCAFHCITLI